MAVKKITVTQYTCEHCRHVWQPRAKAAPKVCPNCKRRDWNVPKKGGGK